MTVYSRCPLRLSFAGGGTDLDAFAYRWGGCVVSTTITRYVWVKMEPGNRTYASYPLAQSDVAFLEKLGRYFPPASLELRVDVPPRSGLGASGAIGVAVLGALNTMKGDEPLSAREMVALAHKVEEEDLGIAGGRQDQIAACWGGVNYIEFGDGRFNVTPIDVTPETLLALESSLLLTFIKARKIDSGAIMTVELNAIEARQDRTINALLEQKGLANDMRKYLRRGDLRTFGELLDQAWQTKKRQSPLATTDFIDEVYDQVRRAGALGGKLSGAGGGGYFLFFAPGKTGPVSEAIRAMGLIPETVIFEPRGLQVWR